MKLFLWQNKSIEQNKIWFNAVLDFLLYILIFFSIWFHLNVYTPNILAKYYKYSLFQKSRKNASLTLIIFIVDSNRWLIRSTLKKKDITPIWCDCTQRQRLLQVLRTFFLTRHHFFFESSSHHVNINSATWRQFCNPSMKTFWSQLIYSWISWNQSKQVIYKKVKQLQLLS